MTLCWRELTDFVNFFKMIQILDVAAIVPSKDIGFLAVDQVSHCFNPVRALNSSQPSILCILNNLEDVAALQSITVEAYAARDLLELAACLAFFGR
jgi:hypothetical protein